MAIELAQIMLDENYKKHGNTFFKVQGDGILVVVKFEKEHHIPIPVLSIDLRSIYSKIEDWIKSPRNLFGRYMVLSFIGKTPGGVFNDDYSAVTEWYYPSKEEQTEIFRDNCLPEIRRLKTQDDLVDMINRMEIMEFKSTLNNNPDKIASYLFCNKYQEALAVVNGIIAQNESGSEQERKMMTQKDYQEYMDRAKQIVKPFYELQQWILSQDRERIQSYLSENYQRNKTILRLK